MSDETTAPQVVQLKVSLDRPKLSRVFDTDLTVEQWNNLPDDGRDEIKADRFVRLVNMCSANSAGGTVRVVTPGAKG